MAVEMIGRADELAAVRAFLDGPVHGPTALILEGEAGIGKSTVWLAGVALARERSIRVLLSRPSEAEASLPHVVLGDLFGEVEPHVLARLSTPRRRALESALLRDGASEPLDLRALGVAAQTVLSMLTARDRLLIAIDDEQWVDRWTAAVLGFALRRLPDQPILLLASRRSGSKPGTIEGAIDGTAIHRVAVGPMSVGAMQALISARMGIGMGRTLLRRLHAASGGNPFFALELVRAQSSGAKRGGVDPLVVPPTLERLLEERLGSLTERTRRALLLIAAHGRLPWRLLAELGVPEIDLDTALASHVIEISDGLISFTHPLLSSVVYQTGSPRARRAAHRRLAHALADPVDRGRHLARSAVDADAHIAGELDTAAQLALHRGSLAAASELAEEAWRLTPRDATDQRHRRALAAARAQLAAGEWPRARAIASDLLAEAPAGPLRAECLLLLAEFEHDDLAVPVLEEALRNAASDQRLEAEIHVRLGVAQRFRNGFAAALEATKVALALADRAGDDGLRLEALVNLHMLGSAVGDVGVSEYALRAQAIAMATGDERQLRETHLLYGGAMIDSDNIEARRGRLEELHRAWQDRDELFSADVLSRLAWVEFWGERWPLAADHAARAHEVSSQYGLDRNQDYIPIAWIAVRRGELQLAEEASARALKLCEEQIGFHPPLLKAVPGLVALARGDSATAAAFLGEAERQARWLGWRAPEWRPWTPDHVDALLQLGRIGEAAELIDAWEADALRLNRDRVLAQVGRCRGMLAAANGAVDEAILVLEQAAARLEAVGDTFGRARTLLALGGARRRARQKRSARAALEEATATFTALGAATWASAARAELARIGGRTRTEGLSPSEMRVAGLVAEGRTNREIATALFLGEQTVASHLHHIYAKLGIRSRTALAHRLAEPSVGHAPVSNFPPS
jgi:DNA-binding CsgD family transcriptional regulator